MAGDLDAIRLLFEVGPPDEAGERVRLIGRRDVETCTPLSVSGNAAELRGTVLELRDAQDGLRYRQRLPAPIPAERSLRWATGGGDHLNLSEPDPDVFEVVVPDRSGAVDVVLLASPGVVPAALLPEEPGAGLHEFARVALDSVPSLPEVQVDVVAGDSFTIEP